MDWFKGKFTGKPHIWTYLMGKSMVSGEDFPLNQSIENMSRTEVSDKLPRGKIQRDSKGLSAAPVGVHFQYSSIVLFRLADENTFWILHTTWNPNNGLETYINLFTYCYWFPWMFPSTHALSHSCQVVKSSWGFSGSCDLLHVPSLHHLCFTGSAAPQLRHGYPAGPFGHVDPIPSGMAGTRRVFPNGVFHGDI